MFSFLLLVIVFRFKFICEDYYDDYQDFCEVSELISNNPKATGKILMVLVSGNQGDANFRVTKIHHHNTLWHQVRVAIMAP